jgi:hypothetical protein
LYCDIHFICFLGSFKVIRQVELRCKIQATTASLFQSILGGIVRFNLQQRSMMLVSDQSKMMSVGHSYLHDWIHHEFPADSFFMQQDLVAFVVFHERSINLLDIGDFMIQMLDA